MRKGFTIALTALLLISMNTRSFAWGKKGHEMVAQVAMHYLDDSIAKKVRYYLGNISFEEAANWMDDERSNSYYNYMRTWHYVDFEKNEQFKPTTERNALTVLNSAILDLNNYKTAKKSDIKRDILLIFHLVGDIHQPLHTGYGSDKGGNTVEVNAARFGSNLHSTWDTQIIDDQDIKLSDCLAMINNYDSTQVAEIKKINVMKWMYQSRTNLDFAYGFKNNFLDQNYVENASVIIKKQILIAGLRLASVLTEAFSK
jgi:hypothetical protein